VVAEDGVAGEEEPGAGAGGGEEVAVDEAAVREGAEAGSDSKARSAAESRPEW